MAEVPEVGVGDAGSALPTSSVMSWVFLMLSVTVPLRLSRSPPEAVTS